MDQKPISTYPVPALESLPKDIHDAILAVQEKAGFIPNVFITLAHRPDEFRGFFAYHDAVMLRFAVKLARTPELVTPEDHQPLEQHGFNKEDIWDIGAITSFFALSNRMAHLIEMRANDEFYQMGRLPKAPK